MVVVVVVVRKVHLYGDEPFRRCFLHLMYLGSNNTGTDAIFYSVRQGCQFEIRYHSVIPEVA